VTTHAVTGAVGPQRTPPRLAAEPTPDQARLGTAPVEGALDGVTITVVGIYYAPDSTGIAPYTTDLCETLAAQGASVHAVAGVPHYPQWTVEDRYRRGLRHEEKRNGVRVSRVRHFVPRSQDVLRRGLYEGSFGVGAAMTSWRDEPDLVLGVTPNLAGAAVAAGLARRRDVPLGIVVQDLVGLGARQSGIRGGAGVADRIARLEASVLRRADRLAIITDAFVRPLLDSGIAPDRLDLLPNYVHVDPAAVTCAAARRALGWPLDRPIAVHAGNMGLKQGLDTVVEAARLADQRRSDMLFLLVGDGSTRRELEQRAAGIGSIRFVDPLSQEDFPLALAAADCLLINERPSVLDMSMPSKLTSYLAAGRAVIAATGPSSAAASELRRSGAGVLVRPGDPAGLLDAVQRVANDPELTATLGRAGRRYAEKFLSRTAARDRIVTFALDTITGDAPAPPR
jgi:colanic acid biosynthesis glycosyl transferase WcaI